ncbi:MAG: CPBP family intramembrane metalloprotease [Myxococcales bacterium]|nr:CPBP family intramembrane metalloprotease [Myxococcales bacterium]MCB9644255.1 CPBP family intramembrane metalloprotease [Myxococcales bacterium]
MRWPIILTLWKKELLEMLRDRRTIIIMVLLPLVLYPIIGLVTSQAQSARVQKLRKSRFRIALIDASLPEPLMRKLLKDNDIEHLRSKDPWLKRIAQKDLSLAIEIRRPKDHAASRPTSSPSTLTAKTSRPSAQPKASSRPSKLHFALPPPYQLRISYLSTSDASRAAKRRIQEILVEYHKLAIQQRLQRFRISPNLVRAFTIEDNDIASAQARGRDILSSMLPLLLIIMTIVGALYPAVDLTAGEKERGTLETLLTAPITSIEIITGKYLTIFCISMITGLLNMLSLWFTFSQGMRMLVGNRKLAIDMTLHAYHYLALLGFLALIAALSSAVMLSMASFARSFKEGQNYTTPAYLLCFMPTFFATLPGSKATLTTAMIPFVNVAFAIKGTIKGDLSLNYALLTLFSMSVVTVAFLKLSATIFQNEQVLFREGDISWKGLFSANAGKRLTIPSISDTFFLLSLQFALLFYVGISLQTKNIALGTTITLWGLFFLPAVGWARARHFDLKETFRLKPLPLKNFLPITLIVVGGLPVVLVITHLISAWLFPEWGEVARQMDKSFSMKTFGLSLPVFFLLLSVSPGICEEMVFRGFVLRSLQTRLKPQSAILLSAFLFAAFHLSLYRLLPTMMLGVVFGWVCWRTGSIFSTMYAHALHNGLSLAIGLWITNKPIAKWLFPSDRPAYWLLAVGLVIFVAGVYWLQRLSPSPTEQRS